MKAQVKTIEGGVAKDIELPAMFSEEYRPDLIKKAVMALQSTRRQPHGAYPYAGICSSAVGWGSGRGASHVPRLKNGSRAAKVPQAKGGREAHPPVTAKVLIKEINAKEKQKAFRSAVAASIRADLISGRGHTFDGKVPLIFEDKFETLGKTQEVISALTNIGVYSDVERAKDSRKVRAGRGKLRGRRYKQRKSLLIVTSGPELRAARNLAGVDVVTVDQLNVEHLAPGMQAGRLTVWTESAVIRLEGR
ncbi:50S ribosomal protein L4 [Methanoregula sp.]|uniref:50S ribosomal protein L4 n=1 Tax=Methanoregula sp. TaxID=2052170 RepID=UPI002C7D40E5|nr:50S ribosomal protein L4 [Methanoregula sp.]HVP97401.1 50S ribosomal protein L4 [Methanoregula sp.]